MTPKNQDFENENIEFKLAKNGQIPQDIWKSITAFANAEGGIIKFGYDSNGILRRIDKTKLDKLQQQIVTYCLSAFNYPIHPSIKSHATSLNVFIPPSPATERPIYSTSRSLPRGARVRIGSNNVQLDGTWIRRFAVAAHGGAEQISFDQPWQELFDQNQVNLYLIKVKTKRGNLYQNLPTQEVLLKLRAINRMQKPTLLGLLVFGKENAPQELTAPTTNIALTQYRGTSKADMDGKTPSLDDREFSGNIVKQFQETLQYVLSKLPVRSHITPLGIRQDYLAIPEIAVRELLANAIAHRDYSTFNGRIQIDIFSDRIEFCSPGRSLVPLSELSRSPSTTRNPLLLSFMRDFGIAEQRGRGIINIQNSLKEAGLAPPTFIHRNDWFIATLHTSAFISETDQEWLQQFHQHGLNDNQLKALVYLKHNPGGINNSEYCSINNMYGVGDDRRARAELGDLLSLRLISKSGTRKTTRYMLI